MNIVWYTWIFELLNLVLADVSLRKGHLQVHRSEITTHRGELEHHVDHVSLHAQPEYCPDPHCETCVQDDVNPGKVHCTECSAGFGLKHGVKDCDGLLNCENSCIPCEVKGCARCSALAATCATCGEKLTLRDGKCSEGGSNWSWVPDLGLLTEKSGAGKPEEVASQAILNPVLPLNSFGVLTIALAAVLYLLLAMGVGYCYMSYKGPRLESASGYLPEDGFSDAICECGQSWSICVWSCCCPCIRWSDTVSQMHFLAFYLGILTWSSLFFCNGLFSGLGFLLIVLVGAWHRGKIRAHFGLPRSCMTGFQDVIAWLCCQPCAIAQEARHVERALGLKTSSQR